VIAIVTALMFVGYTLLYAAVANGGRLAQRPWDALRASAYDDTSAGGGTKSVFDRAIDAAGRIAGGLR
jgi:hypothetical protein